MRLFETYDEAASETIRDLKELALVYQSESVQDKVVRSDPGYLTHELTHYNYAILDPQGVLEPVTSEEKAYWTEELEERVTGTYVNPGKAFLHDQEYWEPFRDEDTGKFSYTYPERIGIQVPIIIRCLKKDPNTRRAWLSIWDRDDQFNLEPGKPRVPCSLGYQFQIREGSLTLHYIMRSCDLIKHWRKDVALAVMMMNHVAEKVEVDTGTFYHTVFSLHAFAKDLEGVF